MAKTIAKTRNIAELLAVDTADALEWQWQKATQKSANDEKVSNFIADNRLVLKNELWEGGNPPRLYIITEDRVYYADHPYYGYAEIPDWDGHQPNNHWRMCTRKEWEEAKKILKF
ncbi:MAG: hypothetical protein WC752_04710 [Patescibacteria group bacterium]|jgi:hypothetical protein